MLVMRGGFKGWQSKIMADPGALTTATREMPDEPGAKQVAVSRYFRGESVSGAPKPLKNIPAMKYIRPQGLPPVNLAPVPASKGC